MFLLLPRCRCCGVGRVALGFAGGFDYLSFDFWMIERGHDTFRYRGGGVSFSIIGRENYFVSSDGLEMEEEGEGR